MQRVFLVPGFFGFATIGNMKYFAHVETVLRDALAVRGLAVTLHSVPTLPTGSLERRASKLAEEICKHTENGDEVHIVGHSTGGLDARLLLAPNPGLVTPASWSVQRLQVRSVVSVASPHRGAPIADFFMTMQGERWLRLLSVLTLHVVRLGRGATLPLSVAVGAASSAGSLAGVERSLLDDVYLDVLRDFDKDRQKELREFFETVSKDRSLLSQLSPEALQRLGLSFEADPTVRYASVVMRAVPPQGLRQGAIPDVRPSYRLYAMLHSLARWNPAGGVPRMSEPVKGSLMRELGMMPQPEDNDAMVPTLSQVHGELLHAFQGDHLDVLGYFNGPELAPAHVDWLRTRSHFSRRDFLETWDAVAEWIAGSARGPRELAAASEPAPASEP